MKRPFFAILLLAGLLRAQGAGEARTVQELNEQVRGLIERIREGQKKLLNVSALMVMENYMPAPLGAEPQKMSVLVKIYIVKQKLTGTGSGAPRIESYSRSDFQMKTPLGPLQVQTVRTPRGIRIHQASEMSGESWWKIDEEMMRKLDVASKKFGSTGALGPTGGGEPGFMLGSEFIEGLSRSYELELGKPVELDGLSCYHLVASSKSDGEQTFGMSMLRADRIDAYYDKEKLILRKMIKKRQGKPLLTVELRHLDLDPEVDMSRFELEPAEGGVFQDIMEDPVASTKIRLLLQQMRQEEQDKKDEQDKKEKQGKKEKPETPGKPEKKK